MPGVSRSWGIIYALFFTPHFSFTGADVFLSRSVIVLGVAVIVTAAEFLPV